MFVFVDFYRQQMGLTKKGHAAGARKNTKTPVARPPPPETAAVGCSQLYRPLAHGVLAQSDDNTPRRVRGGGGGGGGGGGELGFKKFATEKQRVLSWRPDRHTCIYII